MADLGPMEKELHIYNWSDYIADDTVPNFEKEFGVKVTYDTYESNEEMVAKLQAGATGYDIIVPSGYIIPVLVATDLIDPINRKYITNWGNIASIFQNLPTDPGQHAHGAVAVGHHRDRLPDRQDHDADRQLGRVPGPEVPRQDDDDGRRARSHRRVPALPGALAQLHQPGGARRRPRRTRSRPRSISRPTSRRR